MKESLAELYSAHIDTLRRRHDAVLNACDLEAAVIPSGSEKTAFLDDETYPFKVSPLFKYWVPLVDVSDSFIVVRVGKKPLLVYAQPDDYWYKPPEPPAGFWVEEFEVLVVRDAAEARRHFPETLPRTAWLGEDDAPGAFGAVNPDAVLNHLHWDRAVKTGYEIACMREATRIAVQGHGAAETVFRAGGAEFDIHMAYLEATRHTDLDLPYHNIVALNENAAVLHYQFRKRRPPEQMRSFLIDAGASFNGYASDITRSYSATDPDFAALIEALDAAQQELCNQARVGVDYRELHLEAHRRIAEVLAAAGVITVDAEAAFEGGMTRAFLPHGLGHLIGLQVHDVAGRQAGPEGGEIARPEGHPFLRLTRTIEEGFVFTIEPGLYFIASLLQELRATSQGKFIDWKLVEHLRGFGGIRIEDNVRVLADGVENLTRDQFARVPGDMT